MLYIYVCIQWLYPLSNQVFVFPILNLFAESRIPGKLKIGDWGHIVSVSGPGWAGSWDTALAIVAGAGRHWPVQGTAAQTQTREQLYILSPEQPREAELSSQQVPRERLTVAREACQMSEAQL